MPRKQRFKPNRKTKPSTKETQDPARGVTSRADEPDDLGPGPPETEQREVHPDDAEVGKT